MVASADTLNTTSGESDGRDKTRHRQDGGFLQHHAGQIAVGVTHRLQGGVLLEMVLHIGKQDLVDDDSAHHEAHEHA